MHLACIWIVCHLSAKNYQNRWKFDEVLTKTNLLSFFWDTVYSVVTRVNHHAMEQYFRYCRRTGLNMRLNCVVRTDRRTDGIADRTVKRRWKAFMVVSDRLSWND